MNQLSIAVSEDSDSSIEDLEILNTNSLSCLSESAGGYYCYIELAMRDKQLQDVEDLNVYSHVQRLDVSGNCLVDVNIRSMKYLTVLNASHNCLAELGWVKHFPYLKELDLSYNQIEDVSPVSCLSQITFLSLRHNAVSRLPPYLLSPQLQILDLGENKLCGVGGLTDLRLQKLYLDGNCLEGKLDLPYMPYLRELS
eukprot:Platyproteum_vivax@DN11297_c0_g1_i1.p1